MLIFDQLHSGPITTSDASGLASYRFADGVGFPPSYVRFVTQLGWGKLCGLFLLYIPLGHHPDSWTIRSTIIRRHMDEFYEEMEHDPLFIEPDGYPGIEQSLVPFAMSENGEYLAWNVAHRAADNEFPIYVLMARMGGIRYGAPDLYAFVEKCTDAVAVKLMLGPGYSALPLTFEPLPLVS
ncbi:SMI1/KNR4 family protein [Hymenobacter fodinae]|uniref:Knr4/Smi1-like domain-containing protein n=1 Tax=Hymenobacter fodinae TaxID=2510796 RepID=A0A4Z0P5U7_9BACT|nr:SMI1/KNR4 family protein [Hymenobacter fodinae]TGE07764.1 hypothetical protein EU556_08395 [Hymenobacter fodinae]